MIAEVRPTGQEKNMLQRYDEWKEMSVVVKLSNAEIAEWIADLKKSGTNFLAK